MSRRVKRPLRPAGDRPKGARPYREASKDKRGPGNDRIQSDRTKGDRNKADRKPGFRPGAAKSPARFSERRPPKPVPFIAEPEKAAGAPVALPTKVQTVVVTADENNMRVDRFLEARFPGLSFSHIQRIVRKGELRVNGKRADSKDRLEEGQNVRIPPLKLDAPKVAGKLSEAEAKTLVELKAMTLYEDDDVLVLNKPAGLAVQGGSRITRNIDDMLEG